MGRSRIWCFTNFDLDFDYESYLGETSAQYVFVGRETCPKTDKTHDQGFVYFTEARGALKVIAKELGECHVEECKGNLKQNFEYCSKGNQGKEEWELQRTEGDNYGKGMETRDYGVAPRQGQRKDIEELANEIGEGHKTVDEITVETPMAFHQYGRTLQKLEDIALRKKFRMGVPCEGTWYWGPSHSGKSHKSFEGYNPETHYNFPYDSKGDGWWWDGYSGQETIIFNEFRGQVSFEELIALCDEWPKDVCRRCREPVPFLGKRVIVNSCPCPEEIYRNYLTVEDDAQFYRRFEVIECKMYVKNLKNDENWKPIVLTQKWSEGNTGL